MVPSCSLNSRTDILSTVWKNQPHSLLNKNRSESEAIGQTSACLMTTLKVYGFTYKGLKDYSRLAFPKCMDG